MAEIKRVSYAWNSALEDAGEDSYFLDCFISRDGEMVVDRHASFKTRDEFFTAIGEVIPVIEGVSNEDWQR